MRGRRLSLVALCLCAGCAACGSQEHPSAVRTAFAAPDVSLSAHDREVWAPAPAHRAGIAALVYRDIGREAFARQMALIAHAGYRTVTLDTFVRVVRRETRAPARSLLLTFDGGRLESWARTDAILRQHGYNAVLFVDVGRVEDGDREYLTWAELDRLQASGRWDIQLESGTGNRRIRFDSEPGDVGPFYAYRGAHEVLGGWRERVFSDVTYGEDQLIAHVRAYRPLAFAPPYGNYGQAGTNDPRIPGLLLARLLLSFKVVFTQDRSAVAIPGSKNPFGRFEVTAATTEPELHGLLAPDA